jgi:amino acid transporter
VFLLSQCACFALGPSRTRTAFWTFSGTGDLSYRSKHHKGGEYHRNESPLSEGSKRLTVKNATMPTVLALLFSLCSWTFFYEIAMPLNSKDTAIVVGFWLLVVHLIALVLRSRRSRQTRDNP